MSLYLNTVPLVDENKLNTLVENRTSFDFNEAQLNIYETREAAYNFGLEFDHLSITGMVRGKKVMHLPDKKPFDYLPGETVITAPNEKMVIDFPESSSSTPTQCIALVLSKDLIQDTLNKLNYEYPKKGTLHSWDIDKEYFHLINNEDFTGSVNQLLTLCFHDKSSMKDQIINLRIQEIIIRLMQTQGRHFIESKYRSLSGSPFAAAIKYIKQNLSAQINIDQLSSEACMSRANFYRHFKNELGLSPGRYIQIEKLRKAKKLLAYSNLTVREIGYETGFSNTSYFTTFFKNHIGSTPQAYRGKCRKLTS